jgi:hypothetical protein
VFLFFFQVSTYTQKCETVQSILVIVRSCTAGCLHAEAVRGMCVSFILCIVPVSIILLNAHIGNSDAAKRFRQNLPIIRSKYRRSLDTQFCKRKNTFICEGGK